MVNSFQSHDYAYKNYINMLIIEIVLTPNIKLKSDSYSSDAGWRIKHRNYLPTPDAVLAEKV